MPNFEGTVDNRWRPDLESSQRRVREEQDDGYIATSRALSFVPNRRKGFEPHDAQTRALIQRFHELERLPHGDRVSELLSKWEWMDKMEGAAEKQRFLEPPIESCRRDPEGNEHLLIFLMLVFEPVRRSVSRALVTAHMGLAPQPRDVNWSNREEARMIRHVERERLYDVTREAVLEAVFRLRIRMRDVFDVVEDFSVCDPVRDACRAAVGRLPAAQRAVIDGYFFDELDVPGLAVRNGVSRRTVYNQKAQAQRKLHDDDVFFSALHSLQRVRDRARAEALAVTYPDGRLPDGRRIVVIDDVA